MCDKDWQSPGRRCEAWCNRGELNETDSIIVTIVRIVEAVVVIAVLVIIGCLIVMATLAVRNANACGSRCTGDDCCGIVTDEMRS